VGPVGELDPNDQIERLGISRELGLQIRKRNVGLGIQVEQGLEDPNALLTDAVPDVIGDADRLRHVVQQAQRDGEGRVAPLGKQQSDRERMEDVASGWKMYGSPLVRRSRRWT
jgi:hypothetical protein